MVCTLSSSAGLGADRRARSPAGACGWWCRPRRSLAPGARHDVGHAERAADLDQLAARDDDLAAARQRVEHEQHRGGVVVDDGRVLGAGQLAQQAAQVVVALAAPAGRRGRTRASTALRIAAAAASIASSASSARPRLVCSTVPVRLNTGAGSAARLRASRASAAGDCLLDRQRAAGRARLAERRAHCLDHGAAAEPADRVRRCGRAQHRVDRGEPARRTVSITPSADARQRISGGRRRIAMRPAIE